MKTVLCYLLLAATTLAGCTPATSEPDRTPMIASEGALVILAAPSQEPATGQAPVVVGGPLDTFRDARDLIAKGNALADRGKAILDQAERDGKITVDIRMPAPAQGAQPDTSTATPASPCPGGVCPALPTVPQPLPNPETGETAATSETCPGGVCYPPTRSRILWRFRR